MPLIAHDSLQLVTDKTIYCSEKKNDTIFIGGDFSYIGKYTGGVAGIDTTGVLVMPGSWPRVHGEVYTMAKDDMGGYYIGGHFTKIGDSNRANLAHIDASGHVSAFKVGMIYDDKGSKPAVINSLLKRGNKLYIAGRFDHINNRGRYNAACIDITTGKLTPWCAKVGPYVNKMLFYKEHIYMAGSISGAAYDTTTIKNIVAVDTLLGLHTAWQPVVNREVKDMYLDNDTLYISGNFSTIDGQSRGKSASFDLTTGKLTSWNPNVAGSLTVFVNTICVSGKDVFLGGNFTQVNSVDRKNIACVNKYSGVVNSWKPDPDKEISIIRINNNKTYIGGLFDTISSSARKGLAIYNATGNLFDTMVNANAVGPKGVSNLFFDNGIIFLMGDINSVGGKLRNGLAAFNARTIEIFPFNPSVSFTHKKYIRALKINNNLLYIGGAFDAINGKQTTNAAVYNLEGDSIMSWRIGAMTGPTFTEVRTIEIVGTKVYVGGVFYTVSGFSRTGMFAVDSATAAVQNTTLTISGSVYTIKNIDSTLFIGGQFLSVNGQARNYAAALTISENLLPWNPPSSLGSVNDISLIGGAIYIGAQFKGIKVDSIRSKNPSPILTWNSPQGQVNNITHYKGKIHAGGKLLSAAIDTSASASASTMNLEQDGTVYSLNNVDSNLYAFGAFGSINDSERHQSGMIRFEISTKQEKAFANLVSNEQPCGLQNSRQLWTVNTNLQNPTFTWYRSHLLIETTTVPHLQYTGLQNNANVHCLVQAGTGCFTQQSIRTDTIKGFLKPTSLSTTITGPAQVCSSVPSKFVATINTKAESSWWIYNDKYIDSGSEVVFTPGIPGKLYCWFSIPDSGCFEQYLRGAVLDIKSLASNIAPTLAITPGNVAHKCELDADTFKMISNVHFGKRQWSVNGNDLGTNSDTLIISSMKINDTLRYVIIADTPNCFSSQVMRDSIILNPQANTIPLVTLTGNSMAGIVTFTATTNVTSVWKYLWYKNGVYLGLGVNTNTYSYTPGITKDTIVCKLVPYLGCYYPDTAISKEVYSDEVAINDIYNPQSVTIYPNPFQNGVNISGLSAGDKICLYDMFSRKVAEGAKTDIKEKIYRFELPELPAAVYMLEVYSKEGSKISSYKLNKY